LVVVGREYFSNGHIRYLGLSVFSARYYPSSHIFSETLVQLLYRDEKVRALNTFLVDNYFIWLYSTILCIFEICLWHIWEPKTTMFKNGEISIIPQCRKNQLQIMKHYLFYGILWNFILCHVQLLF